VFITLDGIDGVGKSTQVKLLADWLRNERRLNVVTCRDPGSTSLGEAVRGILLGHHDTPIGMRSEMLLYMAARAQLVEEVIRPALEAGSVVVCDRYLLANVAYQGYGGGLNVEELWTVGRVATAGVAPTLTLLLDIEPALGLSRLPGALDRMEKRGVDFLTRVREGFLAESRRPNTPIAVIDASRSIDEIQADVRARVAEVLAK
jgi:dTMP kinase